MHYYYVCTISPGFVEDPPLEAGQGILWAKKKGRRNLTGVQWSEEGGIQITKASVTKCRKCGQLKPEVSALSRARMKADENEWLLLTLGEDTPL
jgi:palmitoyltransferase